MSERDPTKELYVEEIPERDSVTPENKDESFLIHAAGLVIDKSKRMVKDYISNKIPINTDYLLDPGYHLVKDVVETAPITEAKYEIKEVSQVEGNSLGCHEDGRIEILKKSEIPRRVFGSEYLDVLGKFDKDPARFNENVQDYIKFHEMAEVEYMNALGKKTLSDEEHGKFESYLLKSLENLGMYDVLDAAVAVHSVRDKNDKFLNYTKKYASDLDAWIDGFLGEKSGYRFPGMTEYQNMRWN